MKRPIIIIVVLLLICTILNGCTQETIADKHSVFHEKIINETFTTTGELSVEGVEWVKMWLHDIYDDFELSNINVSYISGGWFDQLSEVFELRPCLYEVSFISKKALPDIDIKANGNYSFFVLVNAISKDQVFILSDILGPHEFDNYQALLPLYDSVLEDSRFAADLKAFPETNLPEGIERKNIQQIIGNKDYTSFQVLEDGIIALFTREEIRDNDDYAFGVALYDLNTKTTLNYVELGEFSYIDTSVLENKLIVNGNTFVNDSMNTEVLVIDHTGNVSAEELGDFEYIKYSPDGSKFAYSDAGRIVVINTQDNSSQILTEGNDSQGTDRIYYYPYEWADNHRLIYSIGGYEWSYGCGIIDTISGEDTYLEQAGSWAVPIGVYGDKLFVIDGDYEAPFDPGYIVLNNPEYPYRQVFKDGGYSNYNGYAISTDGQKMAMIITASDPYDANQLYVFGSEDGSVLKKIEFRTPFNFPQYPQFLDEDTLLILSNRYVYCSDYLYVVDLK